MRLFNRRARLHDDRRQPAVPSESGDHSVAITCAQMAIISKNSASDAKAAASLTRARNMRLLLNERIKNIVPFSFQSQEAKFKGSDLFVCEMRSGVSS